MKPPPLLLGSALLFWGWQSGLFPIAALMAAVIEGARLVPARWELSEKDFRRVWDFTSLLFVVAALYAFTSNEGPSAVAGFFRKANPATQREAMEQAGAAAQILFRWLPLIFCVLMAAQAYSTTDRIPWRVFSWLLRQRAPRRGGSRGLDATYPYFGCCLVGASITVRPTLWFYVGICVLLGWALWFARPRRFAVPVWAGLVLLATVLSFFVQIGFVAVTSWANLQSAQWLSQYLASNADPKESRTTMGEVGRLKLSGKIVMRVNTPEGRPPPPLLREASYRVFLCPTWIGAGKGQDFRYLQAETNYTTWEVASARVTNGPVRIAQYLTGRGEDLRRGVLALPHGVVRLENLPAFLMSTNMFGVVRVDEGPGLVIYDAFFAPESTIDVPPDNDRDLLVPDLDEAVLRQLVEELELADQPGQVVADRLEAWFRANFEYSTWRPVPRRDRAEPTVVSDFLLSTRAGHCEYFATAATLLFRAAGVPARYAVGYAVHERKGSEYVVRERHGHAWCLAWINGAWRDVDVTPPSWMEAEAQRASWVQGLSDAWSRLGFEFSKWRWGRTAWRQYLLWVLVPVLVLLLARLFVRKQWKRFRRPGPRAAAAALPGFASEFYLIEQALARHGFVRAKGETWLGWLRRVQADARLAWAQAPLHSLLGLHYRYRFDPLGLDEEERERLRSDVRNCLQRLRESV